MVHQRAESPYRLKQVPVSELVHLKCSLNALIQFQPLAMYVLDQPHSHQLIEAHRLRPYLALNPQAISDLHQ
jgi:hypothetical protein